MKYSEEIPEKLRKYALENPYFVPSNIMISAIFGVTAESVLLWKKKYPEFKTAVDEIATANNTKVESALLKSALGGYVKEIRTSPAQDGRNQSTTVLREVMPNPYSAKLWLTNKMPDEWKDKREEINSVNVKYVDDEDDYI